MMDIIMYVHIVPSMRACIFIGKCIIVRDFREIRDHCDAH